MRSRGIEVPHENTVKNYAKEYNALSPEDKKKIQMRYSIWSAHTMPVDIPASALPLLYGYKRVFNNWKDGNFKTQTWFEHLKYVRLVNVLFTNGLAKWIYYVLCGLSLQIPPTTDWFRGAGVWVKSINDTPIFITHIDILRMAELQESVDIRRKFGDGGEQFIDPFAVVTNILMDSKYKNPHGDLFVLGDEDGESNRINYFIAKAFFDEEYAKEVEGLIDKTRANDYLKATAKGDTETINKINEEKINKQMKNFQEYVKENKIPDQISGIVRNKDA